jgi:hypothetical protein
MSTIRLREWFALPDAVAGGNMRRAILVALGIGAVVSSAAAFSIRAAEDSAASLSAEQYAARLGSVESANTAIVARCGARIESEREFCRVEAEAGHAIGVAETEAAFRHTEQASRGLQRTRIDARYQVERARCNSLGGYKRDKCLVHVHATRGRAMLAAAAPYEIKF